LSYDEFGPFFYYTPRGLIQVLLARLLDLSPGLIPAATGRETVYRQFTKLIQPPIVPGNRENIIVPSVLPCTWSFAEQKLCLESVEMISSVQYTAIISCLFSTVE